MSVDGRAGHYVHISSISAYDDAAITPDEDSPLYADLADPTRGSGDRRDLRPAEGDVRAGGRCSASGRPHDGHPPDVRDRAVGQDRPLHLLGAAHGARRRRRGAGARTPAAGDRRARPRHVHGPLRRDDARGVRRRRTVRAGRDLLAELTPAGVEATSSTSAARRWRRRVVAAAARRDVAAAADGQLGGGRRHAPAPDDRGPRHGLRDPAARRRRPSHPGVGHRLGARRR